MSRFSDSPYFLLKDFVDEISVKPFVPLPQNLLNQWPDTLFTDVIYVGGVENQETSTQFEDTLDRYSAFNIITDYAQKFESDDVVWNGFIDLNAISYFTDDSLPVASILRGGDVYGSIVVDGGRFIDVYARLDDVGFVPVRLKPVTEEPRDKKYFRFDLVEISTLLYDGTTTIYDSDVPADEPYFDSDFVSIQTEDYTYDVSPASWGDLTIDDILANGTEIFFRKDSSFHDWLNDISNGYYQDKYNLDLDSRNYVNTDKGFIYFGDIYPTTKDDIGDPDRYHIIFNGMKDWVQAALPENNRTDNLVEFLDTHFDQVYSEGYQLLRDVWTLRDGRECNNKFLGYIPTFYGIEKDDDIPVWFSERYREYATELVWLMKRKGTYAAMYIIYELICRNSPNIFNVIERWHDSALSGEITVYEDHIYTGLYGKATPVGANGAGTHWYSQFDEANYPEGYLAGDNKILSPYYRVDLDLCVQPTTGFEILPKEIAVTLYKNWELQRPVNRQAEYNLIYAPFTDLTGTEFTLYDDEFSTQSITSSLSNLSFDNNNFIHIQRAESTTWYVEHTLDTSDIIITSYTVNLEKQIPSSIVVTLDNLVTVTFDEPTVGIVICSRSNKVTSEYNSVSWNLHHGLNRNEVLYQIKDGGVVYYPDDVYVNDTNSLVAEDAVAPNSVAHIKGGLAVGDNYDSDGDGIPDDVLTDDVWIFDTVGKVTTYTYNSVDYIAWVIDHPLPVNIFQVNCFNELNRYVEPEQILLDELSGIDDSPQVVVLWAEDVAPNDPNDYLGFASLGKIGNLASFYGGIPANEVGAMLPVEWRLTIESDTDIYTFLTEGSAESLSLIGDGTKTIHYYDPSVPSVRPFISGTTDVEEAGDDGWFYYTFTVSDEGKSQLNEGDYMIRAIELANADITIADRQRIVYSRISGIYKPEGVNFVGYYRIFGETLDNVLLDENFNELLDELDEPLLTA